MFIDTIGLLIQNSWGTDWGNKGTFILPYAYPVEEAWVVKFKQEPSKESNTTESNILVKPKFYIIREIIMKIIKMFRK